MTRRLVWLALCAGALLSGCKMERRISAAPVQQSLADENARLKRELAETQRKLDLQGRYTADATKTLNELQDHLSRIALLEGEIRGGTESDQKLTASRRNRMIAAVRQMEAEVEHQRKLIAGFREREAQYSEKVAELGAAISRFERVIVTKNAEIARLRGELQMTTVQIERLTEDKRRTEQALARKDEDLQGAQGKVASLERDARAAHYIVSNLKTLRSLGIIVDKRVLLSRVWMVSPNLDPDKLQQIDIDEMRSLSIVAPRNRVQIVSPHPPSSYTLLPESASQTRLTITDSDRFWTTRYLVVGIR
jgi:hypothetical protein